MYLFNGRIYTLDDDQPIVSALAVSGGRILMLGDDHAVRSEFDGRLPGMDLGGAVVIPGLIDAHIHLEHYALGLQKVDCETETREECLHRIAERAGSTPPGSWILGHGWNQNRWEQGFGNARHLDKAAPDHPVYLTAKSLHAGWANSAALRLANIIPSTANPPNGRLGRNADGAPDGILFEGAMNLVSDVIPEPTDEEVARAIQEAQQALWRMGLTGVHDFDRRRCFVALQTLRQRGELRLRVLKSIPVEDLPHADGLGLRGGYGDDFLSIGGIKLFADGALGPHTAAMLAPYENQPANRGMLFMDAEEIYEHGRRAARNGLPLAVHAIGDRANREVLNALAQLRTYEDELLACGELPSGSRLRHRIEHVQVTHPQDAARLAELGVIASMQPIHATSDMDMAERYWGARAAHSYAWRTQLDHGAVLAFGSDAPVESPNPFLGLHAAVSRRRSDGRPGHAGWLPEQRLKLVEALRAYTRGAAYAAGWERRLGKLAPGYLADLIVLADDPFDLEAMQLLELRPRATMVAGEWVYSGDI